MFNVIFGLFKFCLVVVLTLAAGHLITWDGRSLSQHVAVVMGDLEDSGKAEEARRWAAEMARKMKISVKKAGSAQEHTNASQNAAEDDGDMISNSEREKLRDLIRDLGYTASSPHAPVR